MQGIGRDSPLGGGEMTTKAKTKEVDKILEVYNGSVFTMHVPKPTKKSIKSIVANTGSSQTDVVSILNENRK